MWHFFKRNTSKYNLEWLGVDIHSHILPGIDDGSTSITQSVALIDSLMQLGISTFYFTPHIYQEVHPNTPKSIATAYQILQQLYNVNGGYAAEYMVDSHFHSLISNAKEQDLLTLPGNFILIEMSYIHESRTIDEDIFKLLTLGYKPILAHPERYIYYHDSIEKIKRLRDRGCYLQLNLLSLSGYYGSREKTAAQHLIDAGLIDFVGTDVHHSKHTKVLEQYYTTHNINILFKNCKLKNQELGGQVHAVLQQ